MGGGASTCWSNFVFKQWGADVPEDHLEGARHLSGRERQALKSHTNGGIARTRVVTGAAVANQVANTFGSALEPADDDHRRLLAVLAHLRGWPA